MPQGAVGTLQGTGADTVSPVQSPAPQALPRLRRRRPPWNLAKVAARVSRNIRKVERTVEPWAQWWDHQNAEALTAHGPLWVVLGDSTSQGVGASAPDRGYVGQTLARLRAETGEPWRVINLSMSGGRFADVSRRQLPVIQSHSLQPAVVSAVIGSNDLVWRRDTDGILADAQEFVDRAPEGLLLSRVSEIRKDAKRVGVNAIFDTAHADDRLRLYRVWDWPQGRRDLWASDKFHPSDNAYELMADRTLEGILTSLDR